MNKEKQTYPKDPSTWGWDEQDQYKPHLPDGVENKGMSRHYGHERMAEYAIKLGLGSSTTDIDAFHSHKIKDSVDSLKDAGVPVTGDVKLEATYVGAMEPGFLLHVAVEDRTVD